MANTIKINHAAIKEVLKVQMKQPVEELAARIASHVDVGSVTDAKVEVHPYNWDRAACAIVIAHPAGIAMEAKHGALRKAAAAAGFEVHSPKRKKSK